MKGDLNNNLNNNKLENSNTDTDDYFNMDSNDSSKAADVIHTISPGDYIEYYDKTIVRGRPKAMKTTQVLHFNGTGDHFTFLDDFYLLNRDSLVKIVSKLLPNGKQEIFEQGRLMKVKKHQF